MSDNGKRNGVSPFTTIVIAILSSALSVQSYRLYDIQQETKVIPDVAIEASVTDLLNDNSSSETIPVNNVDQTESHEPLTPIYPDGQEHTGLSGSVYVWRVSGSTDVYHTSTQCYHIKGKKNLLKITLDEAEEQGLRLCGDCIPLY